MAPKQPSAALKRITKLLARTIHALAVKTTIRALYQCFRQVLCLKRRFSGRFQELRQSLTFS